MLKIQYCSDLHIEFPENETFLKNHPIEPVGDILILAGDIVPFVVMNKYDWFFDELSDKFKKVYWVPGNHEYYYSDIQNRSVSFIEEIRKNVFLLNNQIIEFDNLKLIFSTLWSKISDHNQWLITQRLSDFIVIKDAEDNFKPSYYNYLHKQNIDFIKSVLKNPKENETTIVISHHVPTYLNYPEKYKGSFLNEAFATELDSFIERYKPNYWIFGHHHDNTKSFKIHQTTLLTNQLGYVKYGENTGYYSSALISSTK